MLMRKVQRISRAQVKSVSVSVALDFGLLISLVSLWIGIFAPVMTFKKLVFFKETYSIVAGLRALFSNEEYFLFLILLVFSVLFPTIKILLLGYIRHSSSWSRERREKWLHILSSASKWSMLEVYVVAMLVVVLRLGILGSVTLHWGLYLFAVSVLFSTSVSLFQQKVKAVKSVD
jgi:paraquat-inducible protein A